jgi:hypothetical protein
MKDIAPELTQNAPSDPDKLKSLKEEAIKRIQAKATQWWETTGKNLQDAELFPFGTFVTVFPAIATMSDWSDWDNENSIGSGLVDDYLNFTTQKYLQTLQSKKVAQNLLGSTSEESAAIWNQLIQSGYINSQGQVLDKFTPDAPNFRLDITLPEEKKEKVLIVLNNAKLGNFALDDQTNVNGSPRKNIKFKSSDGQYRSIGEALQLIQTGATPEERIRNTRMAYDYLMDIYASLTHLSTDPKNTVISQGQAQLTAVETRFQANVSADAQWEEKDASGQWVARTGPLASQFNSTSSIGNFRRTLQGAISLLQPAVRLFSPRKDANGQEIPLRILTDNSFDVDKSGNPIRPGGSQYQVMMDIDIPDDIQKSKIWDSFQRDLSQKINYQIGLGTVKIFAVNRQLSIQHGEQMKAYKAEREEIMQETREAAQEEANIKARREKEEAENEARRQAERRAEQQENDAKAESRRQAQRQSEES